MSNGMETVKVITEGQEKINNKWVITDIREENITFERFYKSYVVERWSGERRYNKKYTAWGLFHTKAIVPFEDGERLRVVIKFEF